MKKLHLSSNKKLAGVCGGIAEYLEIDPTIIRILWAIAIFIFGTGVLAYILAWAIIPRSPYQF